MTLMFICAALLAEPLNLNSMVAPENLPNVKVHKLNSDEHASQFLIFIKKEVPLHIHKTHTETVYVVAGEGQMTLGDKQFPIKAGDFVKINENTPHGVIVTSAEPLKVLSVQTPEFLGVDRHPVQMLQQATKEQQHENKQ